MSRGALYEGGYSPRFSGHETFPVRYGWLKKAFDAVSPLSNKEGSKAVFTSEDAIARFGVGKNMVVAIRHWATTMRIIEDVPNENTIRVTELGETLFGKKGIDPHLDTPNSIWILHWNLATNPMKTTWYWAFGNFPHVSFDREVLVKSLEVGAENLGWKKASPATIKRDVECFVRTYASKPSSKSALLEDTLESPLVELGLIKSVGRRDGFRFERGPKPTLGAGTFLYAFTDFWRKRSKDAQTISFEVVAHEPGSPGRVFLLDEDSLASYLMDIENLSNGLFAWSETAGLKQVIRKRELDGLALTDFLDLNATKQVK